MIEMISADHIDLRHGRNSPCRYAVDHAVADGDQPVDRPQGETKLENCAAENMPSAPDDVAGPSPRRSPQRIQAVRKPDDPEADAVPTCFRSRNLWRPARGAPGTAPRARGCGSPARSGLAIHRCLHQGLLDLGEEICRFSRKSRDRDMLTDTGLTAAVSGPGGAHRSARTKIP